ncbi:ankyrin repeat, PH and SEC7 domain containing protein secG-like [Watersipora subatra]|uniref:ankyrin repeat, PH and SEC7 domain containing protein secG-like n=1 Tax=Watersipora subatra TaxID=2589382 RepID=UPI00355C87AD
MAKKEVYNATREVPQVVVHYNSGMGGRKKMDHHRFLIQLVEGLIGDYCEPKKRIGRPSCSPVARKTARHFLEVIPDDTSGFSALPEFDIPGLLFILCESLGFICRHSVLTGSFLEKGYIECVQLLLDTVSDKRKYEFVAEKDEDGDTAVAIAALYGKSKCIESLIYNFASLQRYSLLNIQNDKLYTPLHCAAHGGDVAALKVLLRSVSLVTVSSLLNIVDIFNRTPQELAEFRGLKESSQLLMRWKKQPVVEGLDDARQQMETLQKKNEHNLSALQSESDEKLSTVQRGNDQKLSSLQSQTEQQAGALDDAKQQIKVLQEKHDLKLSALRRESDWKLSALQRESDENLSALKRDSQQKLLALQRRTEQQAEDMALMQRRLKQFVMYLQAPGDTNLTAIQCHDPDS